MTDDAPRSQSARRAAERALVRIVYHYGARPEFVVLGGLVPELLGGSGEYQHADITDIDVQVNIETAFGSVNAPRLEQALCKAGFEPDGQYAWRWRADGPDARTVVKFELLTDQPTSLHPYLVISPQSPALPGHTPSLPIESAPARVRGLIMGQRGVGMTTPSWATSVSTSTLTRRTASRPIPIRWAMEASP